MKNGYLNRKGGLKEMSIDETKNCPNLSGPCHESKISEISKKSRDIIESLGISVMQRSRS